MDFDSRDVVPAADSAPSDQFPILEDFDAIDEQAMPITDAVASLQAVHDVPVTVQAVLGRSRIAIGELMQLKQHAVIELDRRVGEPVDIFVNNRLIARGEIVMIESLLGVTLTEIVRQER
ncbi:flagellar motor switch protein FliN [Sphingomonas sp. 37zxx]|uniref:flagellar motor switch protein FliN n=1 Tax=Sphingomonas sp. 37zxx TaxID=1550073 RepID=UPI00053C07AF|nr:flagellar motor switch protein FliN [Sphingomonas sp. 37zxx]